MYENEAIINEEVMDEVIELVPEKAGVNFGKIGFGILAAGAIAALGYKVYKLVKDKKKAKANLEAFNAAQTGNEGLVEEEDSEE